MYHRSHSSTTEARFGWSESVKAIKSQRNARRTAPLQSLSDDKQAQKSTPTKSAHTSAHIIQKSLLETLRYQENDKHASTGWSVHGREQNAGSATPSLASSVSSCSYNSEEHSFNMDRIVNRLLDKDDSSSSCLDSDDDEDEDDEDDDDDMLDRAVPMLTRTKKSATCPNLTIITGNTGIEKENAPPLPNTEATSRSNNSSIELCSKPSILKRHATIKMTRAAASKGQIHFKRAATWLGKKMLLASPQVQNFGLLMSRKYHSVTMLRLNSSNNNFPPALSVSASSTSSSLSDVSSLDDDEQTKKLACSEELIYGTDANHFAYLRNQLYEKSKMASNQRTPKRIMYCRVMQLINHASTRDCDYELHVQLNNVTMASKRGVLRKVENNASADRPHEEALVFQVEEPFSLNFVVAARHTNTVVRESLAKLGLWSLRTTPKDLPQLPIAGYTCLNFENKMDILDQGISRFRLNKPVDRSSNRWLNLELLIDIKVEEVLPAVVHRFPWSYTTQECSYDSRDEEIISDPKELLVSQKHCQQGDYLTLYTRGMAHPTWKRYWVVMEEHQLVLHDFTFKDTKQPLSIIALAPLLSVGKPTLDDCENVGIARKTGIMLQFNRTSAVLSEPVRLESDERLDGKAYLYGDDEQNTVHWRRALSNYVSSEEITRKPAIQGGVDLRFLW